MEAAVALIAGIVLVVGGIAGALARHRLARELVQRLGPAAGGQPRDAGSIARVILVIGIVVACAGAGLIVWGWLATDFIDVPQSRVG